MAAKFLLEEGKVNPNVNGSDDLPILLDLASKGNMTMIELYFRFGGNMHATNEKTKWNALHYTAQNGHLEATKFLVAFGVPCFAKGQDGRSPLDLASQHNQLHVVKFLQEVEKRYKKLFVFLSDNFFLLALTSS